jgi:hypothetical protein
VLLGNGDGTFKPAITTHPPVAANSVAAGDFNRDGKLDLVFTNSSNNTVEVLRGNGDGTFQSNPLILPVGAGPLSVAVGDFRHIGKLDLAVTNSGSDTVSVLLGNGDGTFQAAKNLTVGTVPTTVAAVDLGNGQVDLVVANLFSNNVSVLLGNGDGTFRLGQTIAGVANASNVMMGDFNGDGKPDVMVEELPPGDAIATSEVVLFGNGDGTLHPGATQFLGSSLIGLAVGDFSGDGKQDIAVLNPLGPLGGSLLDVFSGNGDGTFAAPPDNFQTGGDPFGVAAGDFNSDGRPDLALANTIGDNVGVLLNSSARTAAATLTALRTSTATAVFGQTETLTATVTSPAGTPTGLVTFFDGATALGSAPVNAAGQATLPVSLGLGAHALTASYGGNPAFAASTSAAVSESVGRAASAVALAASANPVGQDRSVRFTATVTAVAPGAGAPTGAVTFFDGETVLGTVPLGATGKATLTKSFSTLGGHTIRAAYAGSANFLGSSQAVTEQVVALRATQVMLLASVNPVLAGEVVTFTATVSAASGAGTPTGAVTFMDGDVVLGKVALQNGRAALRWTFPTRGSHAIKVVYSGDSLFTASSQALIEQVN